MVFCDAISRILIKKRIYITYTYNFATESKYSVHLISWHDNFMSFLVSVAKRTLQEEQEFDVSEIGVEWMSVFVVLFIIKTNLIFSSVSMISSCSIWEK